MQGAAIGYRKSMKTLGSRPDLPPKRGFSARERMRPFAKWKNRVGGATADGGAVAKLVKALSRA
jgi:hypothetical protein